MTILMDYTPATWFWQIGADTSRYWSSAEAAYVGSVPEGAGLTRVTTEEELSGVLAEYGLAGPVAVTPTDVSAAQAKLALDAAAILDDVEGMIAAHPVRAVRIWYADANVWERGHPYVNALGLELDLDDEAIDALFAAASLY